MKKELEVIVNIGPPASGKSTWTKEFLKKNPGYVKVSRDDYRYMLRNEGVCEPRIERLINELHKNAIVNALAANLNVIVDNTNLKVSYINEIIESVKEYASVRYMPFDVPYDTLLKRDVARDRSVGKPAIDKMWKQWLVLKDSFHFQPVEKVAVRSQVVPNFKSELPDCVIFDVDGTLAIMKNRGPFDWGKVDRDDLNQIVSEQIKFHKSLGRKIFIVSGRDEVCRDITENWFKFYGIEFDAFYMRPKDSYEKDTIVKKRIYETEIKGKFNVLAVYDDRLSVCATWHGLGLFVFNCNQGNKIF